MAKRPLERREPALNPTRARSPSVAIEPTRAPERPPGAGDGGFRRAGAAVRVMSGFFTAMLLALAGAGLMSLLLYHHFERAGPLEVSRTVTIPKGEGSIEIAERLEREGVISNRWAFVASYLLQKRLRGEKGRELKAGEYEFKKNASMSEVIDTIAAGRVVLTRITIPEGLTSQQIVQRLREEPELSGEIAEVPPEGSLLPDTYSFSKGMARQELLARMNVEQKRVLAKIWEKRLPGLPIETAERAVILASIVEKETGRPDERDRVAAVFVNRLRKRMRLQSDPTIVYGIAPGQGSLGRPITREDIDTRTPYNTYHIDGLPPTPISNPGRAAIEATLNPAKSNDLYFVANGDGGHTFTEKYDDHRAAVTTWRKVEKAQREKEAKEAALAEKGAAPAVPGKAAPAKGEDQEGPESDAPAPKTPVVAANGKALTAANVPLPVRKPKR